MKDGSPTGGTSRRRQLLGSHRVLVMPDSVTTTSAKGALTIHLAAAFVFTHEAPD
jgi:hypothetical protein